MTSTVPDSAVCDTGGVEPLDKILLKGVQIDLLKPQSKKSTVSITSGHRREEKTSGLGEYTGIQWEPEEKWDVTDSGPITVLWRIHYPLKIHRKTSVIIDVDKVLVALRDVNSGSEHGLDAMHEYGYVYEDKRCRITVKFSIQNNPQPSPLSELVRNTAENFEKIKSVRSRLGVSVTYLESVLSLGDLVKEIHPVVRITIGLLSGVIKFLETEDANNEKIADLVVCMSDIVDYVTDVEQFATIAQLKAVIEEANHLMRKTVDFVNEHIQRSTLGRTISAFSPHTQEELESLRADYTRFKENFDRGILVQNMVATNSLQSRLKDLVRASEDDKFLDALDTGHQTRALRCLEGTRQDLISFILEWVKIISESSLNILWIYGYPGAGKSTLAMHLAKLLRMAHRLGVIVEFNRTTGVTAAVLWKTIAYALAYEYPECRRVIVSELKSGTLNLANATSGEIFSQLVAEPLRRLTAPDAKIVHNRLPVIVIDALDECGGLEGSSWKVREEILRCFADWPKLGTGVKLIVTSRAEQDIKQAFSSFPHNSLEISTGTSVTDVSTHDIQLYMNNEFKRIARANEISGDWPGDETIADLSRRAQGVFIWAVTVLDFIDDVNPRRQLKEIQDGGLPSGSVYDLYRQILEASFPHPRSSEHFRTVVGAIVVIQQALTPTDLGRLVGLDTDEVNGIRKGLRTVLDNTDVVRFRHQSFVDFLISGNDRASVPPSRKPSTCPERFRINPADAHMKLCESSFRLMHKELRFNICNMPSSFLSNHDLPYTHFEKAVGRALVYACQFWKAHLSKSQSQLTLDLVNTFISIPSLTVLGERILFDSEQSPHLLELLKDAISFVQYCAQVISRSVPHIYTSALAFAPKSSKIAQLYTPLFKNTLDIEIGRMGGWPTKHVVIHAHLDWVNFAAFSPDGNRVVSCSDDMTVQVHDVETGEIIDGPSTKLLNHVLCAVYSTDGKKILSVLRDSTIQTWSAESSVPYRLATYNTDTPDRTVSCVAFSRSRECIVSAQPTYATTDGQTVANAILVRDVETGRVVVGPFVGHGGEIRCVTFSPDDRNVASGSDDKTIRVWSAKTGLLVAGPLKGHQGSVLSISYSREGAFIASGSQDRTIRLWAVGRTSPQIRVYEGHLDWVRCVSFSNDDRWIVSGSGDRTIRVWDVRTGLLAAGPFEGHTLRVSSVAFSPDDKRIVSGSWDRTVRIWDVEADKTPFEGHGDRINSVALSNDGRCIVSGSDDMTIRIWDVKTGQMVVGPLKGHEGAVYAVAYSPDGKKVLSGSGDTTIRLWDVSTEQTVLKLCGHEAAVSAVAYSNNGRYVASGSWDDTKRIWDAKTGECIHILAVESKYRGSIAFSPDDKRIVSSLVDGFGIWYVKTGSLETKSGCSGVYSVTFSHDGTLVATGSFDGTIRVWNVMTGIHVQAVGPFVGHTDCVHSIVFTPDGKFIVSGSWDNTIRIWDAKTGQAVLGPFKGHTDSVSSVAVSYDSKYIASGSYDNTIRIWSTEHKQQLESALYKNDSEVDHSGWVKDDDGRLLFWVPQRHRLCLHKPNNTRVIGPNETRLDFRNARWGEEWTQCHTEYAM